MKKTILICGLLVVGLVLLSGCHTYNTRVALGVDYYGDYGYPAYPCAAYYPYYPYYYSCPAYYYPYYPYYPYFSFGFGFVNIIDGHFVRVVRGGRVIRGPGVITRSGGRIMRR